MMHRRCITSRSLRQTSAKCDLPEVVNVRWHLCVGDTPLTIVVHLRSTSYDITFRIPSSLFHISQLSTLTSQLSLLRFALVCQGLLGVLRPRRKVPTANCEAPLELLPPTAKFLRNFFRSNYQNDSLINLVSLRLFPHFYVNENKF
jgi:hypothetical protein